MKSILFLVLGKVLVFPVLQPANIICMYVIGTKSQLISFMIVVEELARRGHDVTVVSSYK